jgi:hypothetical protein
MCAPVASRFRTYKIECEADGYCDTLLAMPEWPPPPTSTSFEGAGTFNSGR